MLWGRRGAIRRILTLPWIARGWVSSGQNPGSNKELTIDLGGSTKMDLLLLPAGKFIMGEKGDAREKPVHTVKITHPFYLGKYEVTREQFDAVVLGEATKIERATCPVDFARWETCQEFLTKLNQMKPGAGFRLPTEAEWEYAARAGTTTRYSFGNDEARLSEYAWFGEIAGGAAHPVGQKKPNPWGLYDMHGNVWEWCQDRYGPYDARNQTDPTGPPTGQRHVFRGGAWNCPAEKCRSASRDSFPAAAFVLGFRVAMPAPIPK